MDRWISSFLEAQAAEQGAARNTLLAYGRDLKDFADWLDRRASDFARAARDDVPAGDRATLLWPKPPRSWKSAKWSGA